jgi:hypothetical protein
LGLDHLGNKPKTAPRKGSDDGLRLTAISESVPRGVDASIQNAVRDNPTVPDLFDKFVFHDDPIAIFD